MKLLIAVIFFCCTILRIDGFFKYCGRHHSCTENVQFMCCLCSIPNCLTSEDCGPNMACFADRNCGGFRLRSISDRLHMNRTAVHAFAHGYICKDDSECEDGAFCLNGDCVPDFMKKALHKRREKRGEAWIPHSLKRQPGYKCLCTCRNTESYPPECKRLLKPCEHDDDCPNNNSMCHEKLCTHIMPEFLGDNERFDYNSRGQILNVSVQNPHNN